MHIHLLGSTPQRTAPAKYGVGCGLPSKTSFEVIIPAGGIGMPDRLSARGACLLDAAEKKACKCLAGLPSRDVYLRSRLSI